MLRHLLRNRVIDGLRDLVHESGEVLIANISVVNIERLVDNLAKSSRSDEFVGCAPALESARDERVTETESGGEEFDGQSGLQFRVVAIQHSLQNCMCHFFLFSKSRAGESYFSERQEVETFHDFFAQHHGQEFVVCDLLHNSSNNMTRFLHFQ